MKQYILSSIVIIMLLLLTGNIARAQRGSDAENADPTPTAAPAPTGDVPPGILSPTPKVTGTDPRPTRTPIPTETPTPRKHITPTPTPQSDFGSFSPTETPYPILLLTAPSPTPEAPKPVVTQEAPALQANIQRAVARINNQIIGPSGVLNRVIPASIYGNARTIFFENVILSCISLGSLLLGIRLIRPRGNGSQQRYESPFRHFFQGLSMKFHL